MKRAFQMGLVAVLAAETLVVAQNKEVTRILEAVREALGGEVALAAVENLAVEGTSTRATPDGTSRANAFEMTMQLPDKFVKRSVLANVNGMEIARSNGFNGDGLIEELDTPPQMGGMIVMRAGPGAGAPGEEMTEEEAQAQRARTLVSNRQEFARLALGMFGQTSTAYPVDFSYVGEAEAPDGKAFVLDATGPDEFQVRLFIDQESHLPLMLSWMDLEPMTMVSGGPQTVTMGAGHGGATAGHGGGNMSMAQAEEQLAERIRAAEAEREVVEHRLFYADYKTFDGVRLPTRIQRMVDGEAVEELAFDKVTINGTVDPKTFAVSKGR